MSFSRREFMQVLAVASAGGMALDHKDVLAAKPGAANKLYDLPKFGNVSFLHFTDCHAQLMPIYFREPNVNLGVSEAYGRPPHVVGEGLLKHFNIRPGTAEAHAFTYLNFEKAAKTYGKVGGFAHLATLVNMLQSQPTARHAARRWRHLAGQCYCVVDQRPGHGRCLQTARRRRHVPALGIHLR
jgi:sulfur-oxidizing protein SoxB